ncbi:hypothetical protein NDU88_008001 [Pleurodeles waltl]|uniref:Uncharacterized protein n=1 Tax=Pleurodeles waltl TaxID=8319 RepID=A0AAV7RUK5_PLEWA|nr:hypothetical protein NDU88_008001 [Pleurodeles waltl]
MHNHDETDECVTPWVSAEAGHSVTRGGSRVCGTVLRETAKRTRRPTVASSDDLLHTVQSDPALDTYPL